MRHERDTASTQKGETKKTKRRNREQKTHRRR